MIALQEERGEGMQWDNIDERVLYTKLTFDELLLFMFIDGIIYGLIGWYASNVFPGEYIRLKLVGRYASNVFPGEYKT